MDGDAVMAMNGRYLFGEKYPLNLRTRLLEGDEAVLAVLRKVQAALAVSSDRVRHSNAVVPAPPSPHSHSEVDEVLEAVDLAVDRVLERHAVELAEVYDLFRGQEVFPLPVAADEGAAESLRAACARFSGRMSERSRQVAKAPSSLAARLMWEKMRVTMAARRSASLVEGDNGGDLNKEIVALLQADFNVFRDFLKECFQTQLLLEYFSHHAGLLDVGS